MDQWELVRDVDQEETQGLHSHMSRSGCIYDSHREMDLDSTPPQTHHDGSIW